jgi:DNA-binding NtrC family response regulator
MSPGRGVSLMRASESDESLLASYSGRRPQKRLGGSSAPTLVTGSVMPSSEDKAEDPAARTPAAQRERQFMVGNSPAMRHVFELIRRFARTDVPVLITGESGTGKELAARAIHDYSSRSAGPFVPINCASLPPELIASELFGYERGAFTGATARKQGLVETANGGTLFLDEIGDLGVSLQGHLLRFLQESRIVRVGGHAPIPVDVRIVSATNVDLTKAVSEGRFREDLFYRLNVLNLQMPALRERGDDIYVLAMFFLRRLAAEFGREVQGFDTEAFTAMWKHPWPGNVREMIAAIRRAVVVGNTPLITVADLALTPSPQSARSRKRLKLGPGSIEEREALLAALDRHHHVVAHVAEEFGVSRVTLYRMLYRHNLRMRGLRAPQEAGFPGEDAGHTNGKKIDGEQARHHENGEE